MLILPFLFGFSIVCLRQHKCCYVMLIVLYSNKMIRSLHFVNTIKIVYILHGTWYEYSSVIEMFIDLFLISRIFNPQRIFFSFNLVAFQHLYFDFFGIIYDIICVYEGYTYDYNLECSLLYLCCSFVYYTNCVTQYTYIYINFNRINGTEF